MKRSLYIPIIILIAASCKKDLLITYNTADNVYFNYKLDFNSFIDSIGFSFAYSDASIKDSILLVPIGVTGVPAATDRVFKLVADPASTALAGIHYELPEPVIHAGKVQDTLRVRFKRAADLASGEKKLILKLQANEFFKTDLQYRTINNTGQDTLDILTFSIQASDLLGAGPYWSFYGTYFGTFSIKKMQFIHDLLEMPLDFWSQAPGAQQRTAAIYYASTTSRYLGDQAALGNIILDEDGTPMKMGPGY
jgi:hypothetical protein